jgi:hypothetical protein
MKTSGGNSVNKTLRVLLCCAVALTVVSFAAAQDIGHMSAGAVLPPAATYSNCGTGCTSYNTGSGYFVTGTSNTASAGQVLAEEFTNNGHAIAKAIEANSIYTGAPKLGALLLADVKATALPGGAVKGGKLRIQKNCPPATGSAPCVYKPKAPVVTKKGQDMWLCQYLITPTSGDAALWMLSLSDTATDNFAFINGSTSNGSCLKEPWILATGSTRSAFEIN